MIRSKLERSSHPVLDQLAWKGISKPTTIMTMASGFHDVGKRIRRLMLALKHRL